MWGCLFGWKCFLGLTAMTFPPHVNELAFPHKLTKLCIFTILIIECVCVRLCSREVYNVALKLGLPELRSRAACLCSAVMPLPLCSYSAVMSFLYNVGPEGAAGAGGGLKTRVIEQETTAAREDSHTHTRLEKNVNTHTQTPRQKQGAEADEHMLKSWTGQLRRRARSQWHTHTYNLIKAIVMKDPQSLLEPHQC